MKIYDIAGKINTTKNKLHRQVDPEGNTKGPDGPDNQKSTIIATDDSGKRFVTDKIKLSIASEPEVRSDRVAELKEQIKRGEYKVDPQQLAGNMLVESLKENVS